MVVTGVSNTADDGDGDLFHTKSAVQAVHGTDQTGGVAGGQLQIVSAQAQLVVGIAMEEDIGNGVLLAALEDGLNAQLLIDFLVLCANATGSGVQHNINALAQILKRAGNGNIVGLESLLIRTIDQVQIVLDAVRADHIIFPQGAHSQGRGQISNTDQFHILLHCNTVSQTLTDGAVTCHANTNLCHKNRPPIINVNFDPTSGFYYEKIIALAKSDVNEALFDYW